ncbi:AraC family transcriptional regulator, partial [Paraburkholderia fynbosensis]|uniref:AraC family transcriptional regulator n=1 Tax=Paraburkholderia fynbosensis TaxID=1200993 RepID=UPI001582CEAF
MPISGLADAVHDYIANQEGSSPFYTAVDGLIILCGELQRHPTHLVHKPSLCIVVQGAKWTSFGSRKLEYRAGEALVVSLDMPGASQIMEGGPNQPYLSVIIQLDQVAMREVSEQQGSTLSQPETPADGSAFVIELEEPLIDCALRAVRLLDVPAAIPVLYPLIMREICFWLLAGPHGDHVSRMIVGGDRHEGIVRAMQVLREQFAQTFRIDELATVAKLSPSAFHHKFKALTSLTPLQYQKQIRLLEARRLMAAGEANVQTAAVRVG